MIRSSNDHFMANCWYLVTGIARLCLFLNGATRTVVIPKKEAGMVDD
jgi:hypothetical protein